MLFALVEVGKKSRKNFSFKRNFVQFCLNGSMNGSLFYFFRTNYNCELFCVGKNLFTLFCPSRLRLLMSPEYLQETHNERILKTSLMVTLTAYCNKIISFQEQ